MHRIGIIGAMAEEVALLASRLDNLCTRQHVGSTFHVGQLHGVEVVILQSGIGKVNAAVGTTLLLDMYQPQAVINTGSAGGFGEGLEVGDVVISS
ncbi:MAG: 5'-methylthioadenosine/S-adenosylhomocysteine nucleosidase, partial [Halomonas sp.]|nr:5'-methylthioadenosine/S-adenosylhomocysteine nucleosidase [Halomonas sp.]